MKVLLLAGTAEARACAAGLKALGIDTIASLAGATKGPAALDVPMRIGGFGGPKGLRAFIAAEGITHIIDATHPFAHRMTDYVARLAAEDGLPHIVLSRAAWVPSAGDRWHMLDNLTDARGIIPGDAVIFAGTGRQTLPDLACFAGQTLYLRVIDPPVGDYPFTGGAYLQGAAPFTVAEEIALFKELRIDWLIVKNAGGKASWPKLQAARELGLQVAMVARPALPETARIMHSVEDALDWVQA